MPHTDLTGLFLPHLEQPVRTAFAALEELSRELRQILGEARATWPDITVSDQKFLLYLAKRVPSDVPSEQALSGLHCADLYLACACQRGDEAAIAAFESSYGNEFNAVFARMRADREVAADVRQLVWQKLFVSEAGRELKIASYSGRGALRSWLRAVIMREFLSATRKQKREFSVQDSVLEAFAADEDEPGLQYLKKLYRGEFKAAFESAIAGLESDQRLLLRYRYLDGLNIDQIGAIYRTHRATIARRLVKLRQRLLADTQRVLTRRLNVDKHEFESIMRLIQSRLEVSIEQYLALEEPPDMNGL